jgi:uncharacterized protein (TIGR02996 family)
MKKKPSAPKKPAKNPEDAFLADIVAHPDDVGPRLVFADWLDDHGEPERAEFIRLQIERPTLAEDDERRDDLLAREGYLLWGQQQAWKARLGIGKASAVELRLARGFVEGMILSADAWLRGWRRWVSATPLRRLTLSNAGPRLQALLDSGSLASLRTLDLGDNDLDDESAKALAGCPHLANLRALHLPANHVGPRGASHLAGSPHLAHLAVLDLSGNAIADVGAKALALSPHLTRLEELYLGGNQIGDDGARALASSPNLAGLKELMLFVNDITNAGAKALTASPHLKNLRKLYLNQNRLTPQLRASLEKRWGERISCAPGR